MVIPVAPAHAEQWQKLNVQGYVNDFAGVLNAKAVEKLTQVSTEVDQKAKAQIAVVTIKTLEGDTAEDFANHLFQKWGVGAKGTDRGVMVLLATDDHKYWTEVGYGLEPILPDGKVGEFGRSMVPFLRQGDNNGAVLQMVSQIAGVIAQDSHVSLDSLTGFQATTPAEGDGGESNCTLRPRDHYSCHYLNCSGALLTPVSRPTLPAVPLIRRGRTRRLGWRWIWRRWRRRRLRGFGGGSSGGGGAGGGW